MGYCAVAFEQTRAADLAAVYRALAALAEAPDLDTLHDRQDDVEHLLPARPWRLNPTPFFYARSPTHDRPSQ